jgi:hypothetical protein
MLVFTFNFVLTFEAKFLSSPASTVSFVLEVQGVLAFALWLSARMGSYLGMGFTSPTF